MKIRVYYTTTKNPRQDYSQYRDFPLTQESKANEFSSRKGYATEKVS